MEYIINNCLYSENIPDTTISVDYARCFPIIYGFKNASFDCKSGCLCDDVKITEEYVEYLQRRATKIFAEYSYSSMDDIVITAKYKNISSIVELYNFMA